MKKLSKILSLTLVFILLLSTALLTSCGRTDLESLETDGGSDQVGSYIIKTEIKDGAIWVTYSNDPTNPVNIGAFSSGNGEGSYSSGGLNFMPLGDGSSYGVVAGSARYLEEIVIPDSFNGKPVTTILESAFSNATNLKRITIPNSIVSVGDSAFYNCGNLEYNEKDNALYLGNAENPYLILVKAKDTTVTRCDVNAGTIAICDNAFNGCSEMSIINIPDSVQNIGSYAFRGCSSFGKINIPEGCTYIGTETFYGCATLQKINIPASVSSIGKSAFESCVSLTEITFTNGSKLVGFANKTFSGCESLKKITIPKSVTYIGDNKTTSANDGVFHKCKSLETVGFEQDSQLKQIGSYAFDGCETLKTINLPSSLNQIGTSAFRTCKALTSIAIPDNVLTIAKETFYNCTSLKSVSFGKNLTKIGAGAFQACSSINNVIIPASVKTIEKGAFDSACTALNAVTFKDPNGWYNVSTAEPIDAELLKDSTTALDILQNPYEYKMGIGKP